MKLEKKDEIMYGDERKGERLVKRNKNLILEKYKKHEKMKKLQRNISRDQCVKLLS